MKGHAQTLGVRLRDRIDAIRKPHLQVPKNKKKFEKVRKKHLTNYKIHDILNT